jgi:prepilin-type N-terminal cleavage/methylation domain-containing protein
MNRIIPRRPGFSLIEILIAVAISSIVSLILYNAFSQTNRVVQQVRSMIADTSDTLSSYAQLEKDFSAIFIPFPEQTQEQKPAAQQESASAQKPAQPAPKPQQAESKKPEITPFKTTTKEGKLATISFVTTNAFLVLDEAASRVVRVTYALKAQEEGEKKLYTLWREEVPYDQKAEVEKKGSTKPAHAYPLIRNISDFSAKFSSVQCKEDAKELVTLTEWGTDLQKKQCPEGIAPQNVELTWDITDPTTQRVVTYIFATTIPAAYCKPEKPTAPAAKPQEAAPAAQQSQQSGKSATPTQPQAGTAPQQKTSKLNIILGGGAKK